MAARRTTFAKMQRDRAKKAKAAAKRERRLERNADGADAVDTADQEATPTRLNEGEIIDRLEALHQRFEDGAISFDDFEEQKAALLARLSV